MGKKRIPPAFIIAAVVALAAAAVLLVVLLGKKDAEPEPEEEPYVRTHVFPDEMRGVYVPTVYNLTFPSATDLSEDELKAEIDGIISTAKDVGLNTVVFQVRPCCDAFYKSDIFPVSKYLSTKNALTLDCLGYLVERAHAEGISVTAWVNPLRVSVGKMTVDGLDDESPAKGEYSEYVVSYGEKLYFDPAEPAVRELVCRGVSEIVENYEVDGILFDDYFYPYKVYETDDDGNSMLAVFDDEDSFAAYAEDGETLDDFRRDNINELVKAVNEAVKSADEKCRFGVAPFGIWKNGDGAEGGSLTSGLESYSELYCDTLAWVDGGYVDYIAPQIYWETSSLTASFKVLAAWWSERLSEKGVDLYFSHAAYRYEDDDFSPGEITKQLNFAKELDNYGGSIFYSFGAFRDDLAGICEEIGDYYKQ